MTEYSSGSDTDGSTLGTVKSSGGLRLAFAWIRTVVDYLVELFGSVGTSAGAVDSAVLLLANLNPQLRVL